MKRLSALAWLATAEQAAQLGSEANEIAALLGC